MTADTASGAAQSRQRPVSLPRISFQSFDPTAEAAGKEKAAPGEAGRPKGNHMLSNTMERPSGPHAPIINREINSRDGIDRAMNHAAEWLRNSTERAQKGVYSEQVTITPEMAALLLKKNPDNRNLSKKRIAEIRADLERGRYVLNGEPIIVSKDGLLNDGQHRLLACVESGVTFRSLMVFGVARSSRLTLDQGGARTVADYLDMQGMKGKTAVAATVARMIWQYDRLGRIPNNGKSKDRTWPTKAECLVCADENEREILNNILAVQKTSRLIGSLSLIVFCRMILSRADSVMGPVFIDRLLDGSQLKPDSPIFLVRERFINDPKMRQPERFEAIVRGWNAMRKGKAITRINIMGIVPKVER